MLQQQDSFEQLCKEIEQVRNQMVTLGTIYGFLHPDVQECSNKLDRLLLEYYEMNQKMKNP